MILSGSDVLRLVTGSAVTVDVHVAYEDYGNAEVESAGRKNTAITGADTTTILSTAGVPREIEFISIHNKHASSSNLVTLQIYNGTTAFELDKRTLLAGESLTWSDSTGFTHGTAQTPSLRVQALTATTVLTAADSGKVLTLGTAGGFDTKLPAPAAGLFFSFVVKVAPTTAYTITSDGTTQNVIHGLGVTTDVNSATDPDLTGGAAVDVITFVANKALIGDRVDLYCDGTLWYAIAYCNIFDGITFS